MLSGCKLVHCEDADATLSHFTIVSAIFGALECELPTASRGLLSDYVYEPVRLSIYAAVLVANAAQHTPRAASFLRQLPRLRL